MKAYDVTKLTSELKSDKMNKKKMLSQSRTFKVTGSGTIR